MPERSHPILTSRRLRLTPMALEDCPDLLALNADPEVLRYTGDPPFPDLEAARALVRGYDQYQRFGTGRLVCRTLADETFLGFCGLKTDPESGEVDLGYRLRRAAWGQGYATEASAICLDYGFEALALAEIVARAMEANRGSIRVLEKLGFQEAGSYEEDGERWRLHKLGRERWRVTRAG